MEGCLANLVKYLLFTTNFVVLILGCAVFGVSIWFIADSPSFMDLFQQAEDILGTDVAVGISTTAAILLLVVSVAVIIVTFFGCCGAYKESKCMLGTYFGIVLAIFVVMIVGAVLGYTSSSSFEEYIKDPLQNSLGKYVDNPTESQKAEAAYKSAWNAAQKDWKCCGINNASDWQTDHFADKAGWTNGFNKPEGCCLVDKDGTDIPENQIDACRKLVYNSAATNNYNFNGCYNEFKDYIEDNQTVVVGVAIGVVVVTFLNMLFAFAMCTMSDR